MLKKYIVVMFTLCFRYGLSIQCYECNSSNNSMCLDLNSYDEETLRNFLRVVECGQGVVAPKENFFCRKIVQTVLHKGYYPDLRVTRGCGWVRSQRDCYKADNEDHLETVCQCFSDKCNGGATIQMNWLAVAATAAVIGLKLLF